MIKNPYRLATRSAAANATLPSYWPSHAEELVNQLVGDETGAPVGAAVRIGPRHMGASNHCRAFVHVVSVERGSFFAAMASGIGLPYQRGSYHVSQSFDYDPGCKDNDDSYVPGSPWKANARFHKHTVRSGPCAHSTRARRERQWSLHGPALARESVTPYVVKVRSSPVVTRCVL